MKKIFYIIALIIIITSCYKDMGNYEYNEINKISVKGIDTLVSCDQMDILKIPVTIEGTQYSDTSIFEYAWEVNKKIVATTKDLEINANFPIGENEARFIVTDKALGTKAFKVFRINVSSATAGDGILILSKVDGHGELSFKRLDKDGSAFSPNYYASVTGSILGINPKKIHRNFAPESGNANSGLNIEIDQKLRSLSDQTIVAITPNKYLDQYFFTSRGSVYPPVINTFDVAAAQHIYLSNAPFGMVGHKRNLFVIANGQLFSDELVQIPAMNVSLNTTKIQKTSPLKGMLAPAMFLSLFEPTGKQDYKASDFIYLFDRTYGKFLYTALSGDPIIEMPKVKDFVGYDLIYATHTSLKNYSIAILTNGSAFKLVYLKLPTTNAEIATVSFSVISEIDVSGIINAETKIYPMRAEPYIYFTSGNKLYYHNIRSLEDGTAITNSSAIADLTQYGYDANAKITCMNISRTENEILLGVSRYGSDTDGKGEELKGDLLVLERKTLKLVKKYESVSGYPVDVIIKYQKYLREGKLDGSIVTDNLKF